ncbi:MAG: MFS transporter [Pseudomonadota bacterium]
MIKVFASAWALFLGLLLLMLGNGIQGTLLGIRGGIEGFSTGSMAFVMSAYFLGFLGGSRMTPELIRRVGHVRVFAALGSMVSAVLILYPTITDPIAWVILRVIVGFCFSGVYVTAESWLNNTVDNANRGKALSLYLIVQMMGVTAAQGIIGLGDPSGFILFIIPSVLVSISFAPILLSVTPTPAFETTKPLSLRELVAISPLGCVGVFLLGGVFSAQFGMASVYGSEAGLSVGQISTFIAAFYLGGLLFQYPIGWISDRMDRRVLIFFVSLGAGAAAAIAFLTGTNFAVLTAAAFVVGGLSNPLYALFLAYTNDMIDGDNMAAASGGLVFLNGVGAIAGPIITGAAMNAVGPAGFWLFVAALLLVTSAYALVRMRLRPTTTSTDDTASYVPVGLSASPVVVELAQEVYVENLEELNDDGAEMSPPEDDAVRSA